MTSRALYGAVPPAFITFMSYRGQDGGVYSEKPFLPRLAGDLHTSLPYRLAPTVCSLFCKGEALLFPFNAILLYYYKQI